MKRLIYLLLSLSVLFSTTAFAQEKGDMNVGGSIGLGITAVGNDGLSESAVTFSFAPEYSYFVVDNFRVGADLSLSIVEELTTFTVESAFSYYVKLVDKLYYTPELRIGGGLAASDGYSTGLFSLGLDLFALEFKPSNRIGLSVSLVNMSFIALPEVEINTFNFNLISSPQFGFRYYF